MIIDSLFLFCGSIKMDNQSEAQKMLLLNLNLKYTALDNMQEYVHRVVIASPLRHSCVSPLADAPTSKKF